MANTYRFPFVPRDKRKLRQGEMGGMVVSGRYVCYCIVVAIMLSLSFSSAIAEDEITFEFVRMWPSLRQPWYFNFPRDVAVGPSGAVYVADGFNDRIRKFTSDGQFLAQWGTNGSELGEFLDPRGVAIDPWGAVYVADTENHRIQKFSSDGRVLMAWGGQGNEPGQLDRPQGIAVDGTGTVYVADTGNHRVQAFDTDGVFIGQWSGAGSEAGRLQSPLGIAAGGIGVVYVTDTGNHRVVMFSSEGIVLESWGQHGTEPGAFNMPDGIVVDGARQTVYVVDCGNHRVQAFSLDGQFLSYWGHEDDGPSAFNFVGDPGPGGGIAIDTAGSVYVTDTYNDRIQRFSSEGHFLAAWASKGKEPGQFNLPADVTTDTAGRVYVADFINQRIQSFSADGRFLLQWGSAGAGTGQFDHPRGIATFGDERVYVADTNNHRVQVFGTDGTFLGSWGGSGGEQGQFRAPHGIAVDSTETVYVADTLNNRVQKFNDAGAFVALLDGTETEAGSFSFPQDVALDSQDALYVLDSGNSRVVKFDAAGAYLTQWSAEGTNLSGLVVDDEGRVHILSKDDHKGYTYTWDGTLLVAWGGPGSAPGQFQYPTGLGVGDGGTFYVADASNHRLQAFTLRTVAQNAKAIVVAGGGDFEGNNLWDATQMCANFAYHSLSNQGFTKNSIFYLSSDTDLDLDNNGEPDDVDSDATNANLEYALTTWGGEQRDGLPTGDVVIYLVDHGGDGMFRMSGTETLSVMDLALWLDQLEAVISGDLIIVYDACQSGSFLSALSGPGRIVITSADADENAYFLRTGTISFSSFFWTHVFNGLTIQEAFDFTAEAIGQAAKLQRPQLSDPDTLAPTTYIGNGTLISGTAPLIETVSGPQTIDGTATATLFADVSDADGTSAAWAVIHPPNFVPISPDNPIQDLPKITMFPTTSEAVWENDTWKWTWEGTYEGFTAPGTYQIAIYCKDRVGNTSLPALTTVSVGSPRHRRALIVAGGSQTNLQWPAIERMAGAAYEALAFQGYGPEVIRYYSQTTTAGVDGLAMLSDIEYACTTWAQDSTQDFTVYLVGAGSGAGFAVNSTETLTAPQLDAWLDTLQDVIPGKVTVVYDANMSGSFLPALTAPENAERIVISSTAADEPVKFLIDGQVSFSKYFWMRVLNGANVRDAFWHAQSGVSFRALSQTPQLDDDGDGIYDTKADGTLAGRYYIGSGIMLAGDDPMIGSICPVQTLVSGTASATIWVDGVTTTGSIASVWAVITHESSDKANDTESYTIELLPGGTGDYAVSCDVFHPQGTHHVTAYAIDDERNTSLPVETTVVQAANVSVPDEHEDDDSYTAASWIGLDAATLYTHNFHDNGDEDWALFYAEAGDFVTVDTLNLGTEADTYLELYREDGMSMIDADDDGGFERLSSAIDWNVEATGFYYVRVLFSPASMAQNKFGPGTEYNLRVWREIGPVAPGNLMGTVTDNTTGATIAGAEVVLVDFGDLTTFTEVSGEYLFVALPGRTFSVTVSAEGYNHENGLAVITNGGVLQLDFQLQPLGSGEGEGEGEGGGCIGGTTSTGGPFNRGSRGDMLLMTFAAAALVLASRKVYVQAFKG